MCNDRNSPHVNPFTMILQLGLDHNYIGDGYPLCNDLPEKHFLKKGAKFRLLGSNPNPELLNDPDEWHNGAAKRLQLNAASSSLSLALCNGNVVTCMPEKATIVLDSDLDCDGVECDVHELRTFEAAPGIFFEYVRPPCVNHAFYANPRSIFRRWGDDRFQCGNPESLAASTVCCNNSKSWDDAWRSELFSGERVPFQTTTERCSASKGKRLCRDPWISSNDCKNVTNGGCDNWNIFYWLQGTCNLAVKVSLDGAIAIVHQHGVGGDKTNARKYNVCLKTRRAFTLELSMSYPTSVPYLAGVVRR
jgi:hypothetical protein